MKQTDINCDPDCCAEIPSTAEKEVVDPDEQTRFESLLAKSRLSRKKSGSQTGGTPRRVFRAKLHTGLIAKYHVLSDLPAYAGFGVFGETWVFPARIFS